MPASACRCSKPARWTPMPATASSSPRWRCSRASRRGWRWCRGPVLRTLCAGAAAQRFGAAPGGQPGADAGVHERRDRADLCAVAGQAGAAHRACWRDVPAELDPANEMAKHLRTEDNQTLRVPWRRDAPPRCAAPPSRCCWRRCSTPPAFQVSEPTARVGTVISITQDTVQNVNTGVGTIGGALIGGGIGSLFGGGSGQTVATVLGAVGGGYLRQPGGAAQPDLRLAHRRALRRRQRRHRAADHRAGAAHRRPRARHQHRHRAVEVKTPGAALGRWCWPRRWAAACRAPSTADRDGGTQQPQCARLGR